MAWCSCKVVPFSKFDSNFHEASCNFSSLKFWIVHTFFPSISFGLYGYLALTLLWFFHHQTSRKLGFPVLYGDGSRPAVLQSAGISSPKAVMVMFTEKKATIDAVQKLRLAFPAVIFLSLMYVSMCIIGNRNASPHHRGDNYAERNPRFLFRREKTYICIQFFKVSTLVTKFCSIRLASFVPPMWTKRTNVLFY